MENNRNLLLKQRRQKLWQGFCGILLIAVLYLSSELLIWGLSRVLTTAKLEFMSSVLGMGLVFAGIMILCAIVPNLSNFYEKHIKSAVDFINRHMGAAFAIPMVMLTGNYGMDPKAIGLVVGIFVLHSLVLWATVFVVAKFAHIIITKMVSISRQSFNSKSGVESVEKTTSCSTTATTSFAGSFRRSTVTRQGSDVSNSTKSVESTKITETPLRQPVVWTWLSQFWPLIASLIAAFALGMPLAVVRSEPRIIDGCALWFIWISCVTLQRAMKQYAKSSSNSTKILLMLATLANPVMLTILLMTAYIRVKAYSMAISISDALYKLSSGTQLYTIWTYSIERNPAFEHEWFGAGDAALSMLGCGFVVWGFKLYECRRQLFSASGLVTILVSVAAAAGSVFLGARTSSLMGLARPEALAFAARMTTLALAIPAMKNVGGNTTLTVSLMITNGVLGQLLYPASLNGGEPSVPQLTRKASTDSHDSAETLVPSATGAQNTNDSEIDSITTVAAGIAIGVNGAAMGVAYLYENKSRSAPYATLAMTTYSVATVVFIAVHPFKNVLLSLV